MHVGVVSLRSLKKTSPMVLLQALFSFPVGTTRHPQHRGTHVGPHPWKHVWGVCPLDLGWDCEQWSRHRVTEGMLPRNVPSRIKTRKQWDFPWLSLSQHCQNYHGLFGENSYFNHNLFGNLLLCKNDVGAPWDEKEKTTVWSSLFQLLLPVGFIRMISAFYVHLKMALAWEWFCFKGERWGGG